MNYDLMGCKSGGVGDIKIDEYDDAVKEFIGYYCCDGMGIVRPVLHDNGDFLNVRYGEIAPLSKAVSSYRNYYICDILLCDITDIPYDGYLLYSAYSISNMRNPVMSTIDLMVDHPGIYVIPNGNAVSAYDGFHNIKVTSNSGFSMGRYTDWMFDPGTIESLGLTTWKSTDIAYACLSPNDIAGLHEMFVGEHPNTSIWMAVIHPSLIYNDYETKFNNVSFSFKKISNFVRLLHNHNGVGSYDLRSLLASKYNGGVDDDGGAYVSDEHGNVFPVRVSGHISGLILTNNIDVVSLRAYVGHVRGNVRGLGTNAEGSKHKLWHNLTEYILGIDLAVIQLRNMNVYMKSDLRWLKQEFMSIADRYPIFLSRSSDAPEHLTIGKEVRPSLDKFVPWWSA
jgi:hypothetical protein